MEKSRRIGLSWGLLTPHGERLRAARRTVARLRILLLTPHGERLPARRTGPRRPGPAPNPSWGTITGVGAGPARVLGRLLTPHGERLPSANVVIRERATVS